MQKNIAGQKWVVFAFNETTNVPLTGDASNITANLRIDGGAANDIDDENPVELEDGYYVFDLSQAETNGDMILITPQSDTSNIQVIGVPGVIYTTAPNFNTLGIESDGDLRQVNSLTGHTVQTGDNYAQIGVAGVGLTNINLPDQTMNITGNITGNLSGSVGSLTGHTNQTGDSYAQVTNGTYGLSAIETLVDELETRLSAIRAGYLDNLNIGENVAGTSEISALNDVSSGVVRTQVDNALTNIKLEKLVSEAESSDVIDNSIIAKMSARGGDWSDFNSNVHSLEGIIAVNEDNLDTIEEAVAQNTTDVLSELDNLETNYFTPTLEDTGTTIPAQITALNNISSGVVKTQVDQSLVDIKLDHLVAVADNDDPVDNSIVAKMSSNNGDWSEFNYVTDSLEAVSNSVEGVQNDIDDILADTGSALPSQLEAIHDDLNNTLTDVENDVSDILTDTGTTIPDQITALNNISSGTVRTQVDNAIANIQTTSDKLDDTLELDGSIYRFTENALEQAPSGGGGSSLTSGVVKTMVDVSLAEYDSPTRTEATEDKDEIIVEISALNNISTTQVNTEVDNALSDIYLDYLFSTDYNPSSKPGIGTALLNELIEDNGAGVSRYTASALSRASGSGASAEECAEEVWNAIASGHVESGSFGQLLNTPKSSF